MDSQTKPRVIQVNTSSSAGIIWFIGWLFTISFAKLAGWKILWGLFIWPYYLGVVIR